MNLMNEKPLKNMTSAELDEALDRHIEYTKKLLEEVRNRRANELENTPVDSSKK
jgi:hypothetical protein